MAVVMNMAWAGVTPTQYDAVRREVGWEEIAPTGGILHVARFDERGMMILDVWENASDFEAFVAKRLSPGIARVPGLTGEPQTTMSPCIDVQIETRPSRVRCVGSLNAMPITIEMYEALRRQVGWDKTPPIGGISHVVWQEGDELRAFDVWRSAEDCERFNDERLLPGMAALGWPSPTEPGAPLVDVYAWYHPAGV